jgi:GxxExxY protein
MSFVDEEDEPDPALNAITNAIIGAAIEVHRELGPGHEELVYQKALAVEFAARRIPFLSQHPIELLYKGHVVGQGRLDFLVEDRVVVELKSVEALARVHTGQALAYLRITGFRLAIVINFNVAKLIDGVRRVAL